MINFWNSLAFVYLILLLIGIVWMIDDVGSSKVKSVIRLKFEIFCLQALVIGLAASPILFVMLLMFGKAASEGNMWGLIPI